MKPILGIAVDVPLRRLFDYRAPPGIDPARLQPGMRLWVPFGRRRVTGVLVETRATSDLPDAKLKAAIAVIDEAPVLDAQLLELLRWAADYYRHAPGEVIAAALPAPLRSGTAALETEERWTLSAAARTGELPPLSPRAHRLRELVAALEAAGRGGRSGRSRRSRRAGAITCANSSSAAGCCGCASRRRVPPRARRASAPDPSPRRNSAMRSRRSSPRPAATRRSCCTA